MEKTLRQVSLDDKYTLPAGRAYMTGIQALVRLPLMQRQRDQAAGLNTAGFVTGYRGSPLGNVDQEFWKAKKYLEPMQIRFQAGLNEDLAATSERCWQTYAGRIRRIDATAQWQAALSALAREAWFNRPAFIEVTPYMNLSHPHFAPAGRQMR